MRKSAMLWLISNRWSVAASAERMACLESITWRQIVRLMRIESAASSRRTFVHRGISRSPSSSTTSPRSACRKILNRALRILESTSSSDTAFPRFCMISMRAVSFTSGVALQALLVERIALEASMRVITVDEGPSTSSSTISARNTLEGVLSTALWVGMLPWFGRCRP
jgi:hypothetical protein